MTVRDLAASAHLAPSSHNTQPWVFRRRGERTLELLADRSRALPVNDPDDRELTISCGAALFNLRLAAAHAGLGLEVETLPGDDVVARARVTDGPPDAALRRSPLASAIAHRRTYRRPFLARPVDPVTVAELRAAAEAEGAWLERVGDPGPLAALVAEGDRVQFADAGWRRELAEWIRPRSAGDGLQQLPGARTVVAHLDVGAGVAHRDARLAARAPLLAVLGTAGDEPADRLAAGQALERVLLTGVAHDLQASFLNQPVRVASLRPRVAELAGHDGVAQAVLRMGHPGGEIPPSPRRPLDEVLAD